MKTAENAFNELWLLPTSIAAIWYILIATFLLYVLNFDHAISGNEKVVIMTIFLSLSGVLVYNCKQVKDKLVDYRNTFESSAFGSYSHFKGGKACTYQSLRKHLGKPKVRRFCCPIISHEISFYNRSCVTPNRLARDRSCRYLFNTGTEIPALRNINNSFKYYDEISGILRNCVTDNVIQRGKLLNHAYAKNLEDAAVVRQNSETVYQKLNSDSKSMQVENSVQYERLSTKDLKGISGTVNDSSRLTKEHDQALANEGKPKHETVLEISVTQDLRESRQQKLKESAENVVEVSPTVFLRESFIADNKATQLLLNFLSNKPDSYSMVNLKSKSSIGNVLTDTYKTIPGRRAITRTLSKKLVPKIPMKPRILTIPMTRCLQEVSQKRYAFLESMRKERINSNNELEVSRDTHRITNFSNYLNETSFLWTKYFH